MIMRGARVHEPDTGLRMDDLPTKTIEEFPEYVWKDSKDKDKPKKENDHGMDAMRYLVNTLDSGTTLNRDEMERWSELVNDGF